MSIQDLYRSGVNLPTPEALLGDLYNQEQSEWPEYDDVERKEYLRETAEHQDLLFYFLKTVVLNDCLRRNSKKKNVSEYIHRSLEAYLVLTYVNGYSCWKEEVDRDSEDVQGQETASGSSTDMSELTNVSRLYTDKARGKGKFKGWSANGMRLYNEMTDIIELQRKDTTKVELKEFDSKLKERFQGNRGGNQDRADADALEEQEPQPRSFLDDYDLARELEMEKV